MFRKKGVALLLAGSLLTGHVAHASFGDAVVGGVVGGVVGSVITNEVYKNNRNKRSYKRPAKRYKKRVKAKKRYVAPVMTSEKKIQKSLSTLGFYHGKIDGEINSYETRTAIKSMNNAYEIGDTASLSPKARDALIYLGDLFVFDRTLISKDNSKRAKGKKIQTALKIHGFYHTKIDGSVGPGTRKTISEYKTAKGLSHGNRLDFEEEYQLISSAKKMNDKNIDSTVTSLKGNSAQAKTNSDNSLGTVVLQPAN
ncbi:MAG: peptidoglycan-binding protein [Sulfurovum sp.]|nr:peptidoglycan-binding protein [Sulfurovum sp.]